MPDSRKPDTALVVLNGDAREMLERVDFAAYGYVLAVDGALDLLRDAGLCPDALVGDLDSVTEEGLERFRGDGGLVDHQPDQETTDFEKALDHLAGKDVANADVIGHHGGRIDHLLAALHAALRYSGRIEVRFLDPLGTGWIVSSGGEKVLTGTRGRSCSIIPLLPSEGVTLAGFRWSLESANLAPGIAISCSNIVNSAEAVIRVREGALFIYLHKSAAGGLPEG